MKSIKTIAVFIAICLIAGSYNSFAQTAEELLPKAIQLEEVKGEMEKAIEVYQTIVKKFPENRPVAAKAQFHIGLCYEKLGLKQAQNAYREVVKNYPDQQSEVAMAQERLNRLLSLQDIPHKPTFRKINIPTKLSWHMSLSPDGRRLAFVSDRKLWTMPLSGKLGPEFPGVPVRINTDNVEVDWSGLAWSGDGKWIAFNGAVPTEILKAKENEWSGGNLGIYIISAEGGNSKKVHENFRHSLIVNYKISLSPDGKMLAFSSVDSNECHINTISVNGGLPKQLVDAQAREPAFSPDGKMIAYVDTKDLGKAGGGLWVIPVSGGTPKLVVNAGNASSPVWSPDGDMIAFLDDQQICIVPVREDGAASGEVVKIDVPEGTGGIMFLEGWTPDNKIGAIFRSHTEFGLYTLPATGGTAALVSHGGYPTQPRWSPDGKRIFHTNNVDEGSGDWERYSLAVVPADGGKITTIPIQFDEKIIKPAWGGGNNVSPDGKMIVFSGQTKKDSTWRWQIWTLPIDGGTPKHLTKPPVSVLNGFPCWSPDGKSIAYVSANADKAYSTGFSEVNIYTVSVNGGDPKVMTLDSDSVKFSSIAWSPDGKFIAYFSTVEKDMKAGILKILSLNDGVSHVVKKLQLAHVHIELAWSPDSKRIAFIYGTETYGKNIRVVSITDGSITDIMTGLEDINLYHLDWSRDGDRFVFSGYQGDRPEFWLMEDFLPLIIK
jgi:Tol biopolymer transport system component